MKLAGSPPRGRGRRILATADASSTDPVQTGLNRKVLAAAARLTSPAG